MRPKSRLREQKPLSHSLSCESCYQGEKVHGNLIEKDECFAQKECVATGEVKGLTMGLESF